MKLLKQAFYIFTPLVVGGIVAFITKNFMDYQNLVKPVLSPSGIVFPIAWSIIYLLMGISYYLYKKNDNSNTFIDVMYYLQLAVNALWSIIFFNLKLYLFAVVWIIVLDLTVFYLLVLFYEKYKTSAYLNIPYMLWILFATYITIGIYMLN